MTGIDRRSISAMVLFAYFSSSLMSFYYSLFPFYETLWDEETLRRSLYVSLRRVYRARSKAEGIRGAAWPVDKTVHSSLPWLLYGEHKGHARHISW